MLIVSWLGHLVLKQRQGQHTLRLLIFDVLLLHKEVGYLWTTDAWA